MRALVQRVSSASVTVEGTIRGRIGDGLLVLLGVRNGDGPGEVQYLAEKCVNLRVFEDDAGKMNRSLLETGGAMLVVSQFTLYGDCRRGRRPSFVEAAPPAVSEPLYHGFVRSVAGLGVPVAEGVFGAHMQVALVNDGPVTVLLERDGEQP
ncbi:MAG: D-tyrosyl-tRNA(Tyr) deacylase [Lentisphaeria bacterium]|nr:D-tyrosyl-tRNA(Tyr) deacylase [Lentisphaeria bacterium]